MTELKIENEFYLVEAEEKKFLFDDKDEAMNKLKAFLKELDADVVKAFHVDTSEQNWKIRQIGWKDIAKYLI
jgi:hypothetical protein